MKKLTVKNKLVHVDVFIFHIDNNLTDLKHHFKSQNLAQAAIKETHYYT